MGRRRITRASSEVGQGEVAAAKTSTSDEVIPRADESSLGRLARLGSAALSAAELLVLLRPPVGIREGASALPAQVPSRACSRQCCPRAGGRPANPPEFEP